MAFLTLKGTVVGLVFISTGAFISLLPLLSLLYAGIIFSVVIVKAQSFKSLLPCPLSRSSAWSTRVSLMRPSVSSRAQGLPDLTLLLSPGECVGVWAGSRISVCRLVVTLCSHSTANFPKKASFCVVLSPLSGKGSGIWDNFPCHLLTVVGLLTLHCFFAVERGAIPPLFLQRRRMPLAIMSQTPTAQSCDILSGLTCPWWKMQFCPKVHHQSTEFQQIVLCPWGVMYFGIVGRSS